MNFSKLILRSLYFYRRTHLSVVLGAAVATAILVGALVVGDSVRFSLEKIVFSRLGRTHFALTTDDRYFRSELADDLAGSLGTIAAPLLQTNGIAIAAGGERRANTVRVYGVDERFGRLGHSPEFYRDLQPNEIIINDRLAARLRLEAGSELLLRFEKTGYLPRDAPLALDSDLSIAKRFAVKAVAADRQFGRFDLKDNQVAPLNVYISLGTLSEILGHDRRANIILLGDEKSHPQNINRALRDVWHIEDAGLYLRPVLENSLVELRSDRIFIDSYISKAGMGASKSATGVFTYFVNEISSRNGRTPYSFVSTVEQPLMLADNEIIINDWLADDLHTRVGDQISLVYFVLGPMRTLVEETASFTVRAIVPIKGWASDRDLMPEFPGLADEENCRDWDPGIPLNIEKIRAKDEDYWDRHRGTPKAFVTLKAAQEMWNNRFGDLTAIRYAQTDLDEISARLHRTLDPGALGFVFHPVREQSLQASAQSVDFAQLFLGLSFFIILAALLLTGLLFVLSMEQRSEETGILLALGLQKSLVKRLLLVEGTLLAVAGGILGGFLGVLYNLVVLEGLKTLWQGAVGTSDLSVHVKVPTIAMGAFIGMLFAAITMWLAIRKQVMQSISVLQRGISAISGRFKRKRPWISMTAGFASVIFVLFIVLLAGPGRGKEASAVFFAAGFILLFGCLAFTNAILLNMGRKATERLNLTALGFRNSTRRKGRSLALAAIIASALFIVFAIGANRHGTIQHADRRDSGTGGFALFAESTLPILYDLNSEKGRNYYGLDLDEDVRFVQMRLKDGDDASCLNLNRVSNPRLLGVDPGELDRRAAFHFVKMTGNVDPDHPWLVLAEQLEGDIIPAIADQTVIVWGLGKSIGDTLLYSDEKGNPFKIKLVGGLANSVFQGNLLISEQNMLRKYPSMSGYKVFLVDSPSEKIGAIEKHLLWSMLDYGLELFTTAEKLAAFNRVENTYLSIFLILGGFGLILGSIGLGIVVVRNVMERRGELAMLRALGFDKPSVYRLILSEHIFLFFIGIFGGLLSAIIAVLPALMSPDAGMPYTTLAITFILVLFFGIFWTYLASGLALRGELLPALRNE